MTIRKKVKDAWDEVSKDKDVVAAVVQLLIAVGSVVVRMLTEAEQGPER